LLHITVGATAAADRLTKPIIWKKNGRISLYSQIIAELDNI